MIKVVNINSYECPHCCVVKTEDNYHINPQTKNKLPFFNMCNSCLDELLIEKVDCTCSVCNRKLPYTYYTHYRTRFKSNGMRLRVNTNCKDCSKKESSILLEIKKNNPAPEYKTKCPQCDKIVYEKVEDIPDGENGTNGPWQCDHDHKTGLFRGYLCKRCNTGTGLIGDNQYYWEKAKDRKKTKKSD